MKTQAQIVSLPTALAQAADALGELRAEIKSLQDQGKYLETQLKESGESAVDGHVYRVTISRGLRSKIDWKAIAAKLNPSRQLVTAHTSESEVVTLRVSGHRKAQ